MKGDKELFEMMGNRDRGGNPGKVLHFIPEERAKTVLKIDDRIQKIQELMPAIVSGFVVVSFLLGLAL